MSEIKGFLEAHVALTKTMERTAINGYSSLYEFVLEHGQLFTVQSEKKVKRGTIGECFRNAGELALHDQSLIYCEGYAAGVIPLAHAWCIDRKGHVVEATWKEAGSEYFGIAFKTRFLLRQIIKNQYWGLIDRWENDWPLLRMDRSKDHTWKHPIMKKEIVNG